MLEEKHACEPCTPEPVGAEQSQLWSGLQQKILAHGGSRVLWRGGEPHLKDLLAHGQLFKQRVKRHWMIPGQCHRNAAKLWGKDVSGTTIVTGYARYGEFWQQHSWALKADRIVETTFRVDDYFGMALDEPAALRFWFANLAAHADWWLTSEQMQRFYPQVFPVMRRVLESRGYVDVEPSSDQPPTLVELRVRPVAASQGWQRGHGGPGGTGSGMRVIGDPTFGTGPAPSANRAARRFQLTNRNSLKSAAFRVSISGSRSATHLRPCHPSSEKLVASDLDNRCASQ